MLNYELKVKDKEIFKLYDTSMEVEIDSTLNYLFKLRAYDSSGNFSDEVETTYNALTSAPVVNISLPIVYYANSSLVFKNISEACDVKVYNATGQLLSSFVLNEESAIVKVDYSGLIIVSLQMADRSSMRYKLVVFH